MKNQAPHPEADRPEAWLRAQVERLGGDADLIAAMPIDDVREELRAEKEDVEALVASAREQLRGAEVAQNSNARQSASEASRSERWLPRVGLRVATVAAAALVLYGALWMMGRAMQPETASLVQFGEFQDFKSQFASRASEVKSARDEEVSFWAQAAEGTSYLRNARRTTLGLFPYYDQETVERGIEHLQAAFTASEVQPKHAAAPDMQKERQLQRARIALLIAKGYLMLEEIGPALEWLERTQQLGEGAPVKEATKLLEQIDAMENID